MDSRAKQRLTGAIILVALFVLLVPELLTGPRKAGGDAPSEEGMRRYTIDLDAPASGTPPAAPGEPAGAVELPPVAEDAGHDDDVARARPGESAQPATVHPEAAAPAATPAASAPAPSVVTPMTRPTVAATPVPAASTQRPTTAAPVHTETARPPAPAASESVARGGFAVQLGSFVSRENAERLVREMTAKGFNAFLAPTIKTGGRDLYRVRVGPTRDRASAEALAAQLRRVGQVGSIVSIS